MVIIKLKRFSAMAITLLSVSSLSLANESSLIWKATYYGSVPNMKGITRLYCQQHEPGTFTGMVKNQLKNGALTDKNVYLSHFIFHSKISNGIYFMHGELIAAGKTNDLSWKDHIYYYVYKLTAMGNTYGVWSSKTCKGFYKGIVMTTEK